MRDSEHIHKSESALTEDILKDSKKRAGWSLDKKWGGGMAHAGVSDVVGPHKGFYVSLEIKNPAEKNNPSEIQKKWIRDKINKGGSYFSYVIYNWNEWLRYAAYIERKVEGFRKQIYGKNDSRYQRGG